GRHVKKGAKAIYILGPSLVTATREVENENGKMVEEKVQRLLGFHAIPVFRYEDTEGDELEYQRIPPPPLAEVAEAWGVDVKFIPGGNGYFGAYSPNSEAIRLATEDEDVFYHELAHAAHGRILKRNGDKLKGGQHVDQEIIAEISAAILARLYGCRTPSEGRSFEYIKNYATRADLTVAEAICRTVKMIEQVISEITTAAN
ncbi:MAG: M48 family peptidase, partial [Acidobacteriota bacterium]